MNVQKSDGAQDSQAAGKIIRAEIGGSLHVLDCAETANDRDDFLTSHGFVPGRDQFAEFDVTDVN